MADKQNEFGCTLFIDTQDEVPDIVTELTNIQGSAYMIKGQNKVKPSTNEVIDGQFNKYNLWMLKIELREWPEGYLNSAIELMLDLLDREKDKVLSVLKRFPKNHLLCFGYFYEVNPYFVFNKELVKRLNEYNIDIEFDLYCLNE